MGGVQEGASLRWKAVEMVVRPVDDPDYSYVLACGLACNVPVMHMTTMPIKITGANAGGPHPLWIRTLRTARIAQFRRSA